MKRKVWSYGHDMQFVCLLLYVSNSPPPPMHVDSKPKDDSGQKDDFGKKDDSGQKDDFGKKDDSGQKDGTILKDGTGVGESKEVKFPMKFALVVIIVVGGVFIWKCYKWRMRRSGPYTKESYTHGSSADSGFQNNDMEMFRRKYKHVQ